MKHKVCDEFKIYNYVILNFKELPTSPYKRVKIDGIIYDIVPSYDMENCVVINSQSTFLGKEVEFVI